MNLGSLSPVALLVLGLACTHARTAADAQQEERAAQKADEEGSPSDASQAAKPATSDGKEQAPSERRQRADQKPSTAKQQTQPRPSDGANENESTDVAGALGGLDDDQRDDEKKGDSADPAPENIDVATTPNGLLEPGAQEKVRARLGIGKSDDLRGAVRRFQREHDLPATGQLDHETVEKLGLSPDDIFER